MFSSRAETCWLLCAETCWLLFDVRENVVRRNLLAVVRRRTSAVVVRRNLLAVVRRSSAVEEKCRAQKPVGCCSTSHKRCCSFLRIVSCAETCWLLFDVVQALLWAPTREARFLVF